MSYMEAKGFLDKSALQILRIIITPVSRCECVYMCVCMCVYVLVRYNHACWTPAILFRMCYGPVIRVLVLLINLSMSTGVIAMVWISAVITPLLKKAGLNANDLRNYRRVSNLPVISRFVSGFVCGYILHLIT